METKEQVIKWKPQPKQELALKSTADEILFGGARGGGKTDAGQAWLMYDIGHPLYRALVVRRNATDLTDWIDRATIMYLGAGAKLIGDTFKFPSGARIKTGHLADKDAYQKYQGHEYQKMLIEELTHIPREKDYEKLVASCRSTVDGIQSQIFATTNPDGAGHEWVKERWSIPDVPDNDPIETTKDIEVDGEMHRRRLVFIPSKVHDNRVLLEKDKNYLVYLNSIQDEELKRAWLEGSWEGFGVEGAYYKTQMQQLETSDPPRIVSGLYDEQLPVYTWNDLGIRDSFAIGYFQLAMNQWRCIDYDEFSGESLKDAINRMKEKPYTYEQHYAPHDIMVRELGTGVSRLETAEKLGVSYEVVRKPETKQEPIDAVRNRMINVWFDKDKTALLRKRLKRFHKEFDEKRGIFKATPAHDENSHGADMFGYFAMTDVYTPDLQQSQRVQRNRNNQKRRNFS